MLFKETPVFSKNDTGELVHVESDALAGSVSMDTFTVSQTPSASNFEQRIETLDLHSRQGLQLPSYQLFSTDDQQALLAADGEDAGARLTSYTATSERVRPTPTTTPAVAPASSEEVPSGSQPSRRSSAQAEGGVSAAELAARVGAQFFPYPSPSDLEGVQCCAEKEARRAGAADGTDTLAQTTSLSASHSKNIGSANTVSSSGFSNTTSSSGCHHSGTKLFLGGLRFEVIQAGRHVISWVFSVACNVQLPPCSFLVHRKSKNGKSNVSPTGCASVYVSSEQDVAALLRMNQRIFCAVEGIYVTQTTQDMKELIASQTVLDMEEGKVRGPTHPVVIECAKSTGGGGDSHQNRCNSHSNTTSGTQSQNVSHSGSGTHGQQQQAQQQQRSGQAGNVNAGESASPPPPPPPPYAVPSTATAVNGGHMASTATYQAAVTSQLYSNSLSAMTRPHPHQHSAVLSGPQQPSMTAMSLQAMQYAVGPAPSSYPTAFPGLAIGVGDFSVSASASSTSSAPASVHGTPSLHCHIQGSSLPVPGALTMSGSGNGSFTAVQRSELATYHPYPGDAAMAAAAAGQQYPSSGEVPVSTLFIGGVFACASAEYISWVFSLLGITLPMSQIAMLSTGNARSGTTVASSMSSAVVQLPETDAAAALASHKRVLCCLDGACVSRTAVDLSMFIASNPAFAEHVPLHIERRLQAALPPQPDMRSHIIPQYMVPPPSGPLAMPPPSLFSPMHGGAPVGMPMGEDGTIPYSPYGSTMAGPPHSTLLWGIGNSLV